VVGEEGGGEEGKVEEEEAGSTLLPFLGGEDKDDGSAGLLLLLLLLEEEEEEERGRPLESIAHCHSPTSNTCASLTTRMKDCTVVTSILQKLRKSCCPTNLLAPSLIFSRSNPSPSKK